MKNELKEYSEAFEAHHLAVKKKLECDLEVKQTRYRLLKAKDALKAKEVEMIEQAEMQVTNK